MRIRLLFRDYRYLPYERELARREVIRLIGPLVVTDDQGFVVDAPEDWAESAARLTYFGGVCGPAGREVVPRQAQLEATAYGNDQPALPGVGLASRSGRQATRYSAHGLHEYRGKFNPQVVRALINLLGLPRGATLLDPFCGSGTTLLEAAHCGLNAIGIDVNPLAIEIANAKIASLRLAPAVLAAETARLTGCLRRRAVGLPESRPLSEMEIQELLNGGCVRLPDLEYLQSWFCPSILAQLAVILAAIAEVSVTGVDQVFRVVLSDLLRDVSLQEPTDLRIRRRRDPLLNAPVLTRFAERLERRINCVLRAREISGTPDGCLQALHGDVRELPALDSLLAAAGLPQVFDAVITSPPYATALPYVDTQRLSLVALGLTAADRIKQVERQLIGSREVTLKERGQLETALLANRDQLPEGCATLCVSLLHAARHATNGFRRRNVPALVYKYLADMQSAFRGVHGRLRSGAPLALVVGPNRTSLGGQWISIDTPSLLTEIAVHNGFRLREVIKLDTYQRYAVHHANSIRSEALVILERLSPCASS